MRDADKPDAQQGTESGSGEPSIIDAPTPDAQTAFLAETSAHSRSTRRGLLIAGVVAAILIAAGVTWALWPKPEPKPSVQAEPTAPSTVLPSATSTVTTGAQVPSLATSSSASVTGKKPARTPQAAPGSVAPAGSPLAEIAGPPERTIGMVVVPKGFTVATYSVVFQPYGWGPGGPQGGRLIAKVISSKPTNASATDLKQDFTGHNVSLWAPPQVASTLTVGGTYKGTVQVKPQGDVGVLYLVSATTTK